MTTTSEKVEYGLQHANGYIRWCYNRTYAEDMQAGRVTEGQPGAWRDHTLVMRTITTTIGDPVPVGADS